MSDVFGTGYAATYDDVYASKDYAAETDLIERVFEQFVDGRVESVLDLGCGTGTHALELAGRGYEVVGVDRSPEMVARAEAKITPSTRDRVRFDVSDIRTVDLGRTFDAAVLLFAVLGYQHSDEDVIAALNAARRHVRPGGVVAFDLWYGPAVLRQRPEDRFRVLEQGDRTLLRASSGTLDVAGQHCDVTIDVWALEQDTVVARTHETHRMRFFFPRELELLISAAELELARLGAFPNIDEAPGEDTWSVLAVASVPG